MLLDYRGTTKDSTVTWARKRKVVITHKKGQKKGQLLEPTRRETCM